MHVRRHLPRLIFRSVEMFLLLMPRSFEVFSPACGCPFLLFHKLEHIYYPDQLKFFLPACGVVHSFLLQDEIFYWSRAQIFEFILVFNLLPPRRFETFVSHSSGSRSLNRGSCCTPKFALFLCAISYQGRLFRRLKNQEKLKSFHCFEVIKSRAC